STLFNAASATGIAVDNAGDAFVTGTANAGYVAKVNTNAAGSAALVYATYLSPEGLFPNAIAVDQSGNAYVAGRTGAATLPATPNAFQPTYGGGPNDAFVLGLNPTGSAVTFASYLGGSGSDWANAIAVDSAGHIYITGSTSSSDFPIQNDFQGTLTA